ncbi:MAG TPA: transcriptional regulator [Candidatus Rifleibacterium sp.]|nr:transcriptional regulator [Candidatus Rifleibacterium sp.]HPT46685.1 transcriptional regulator [Candidatus Rifleibacterium sp.]
MKPIKPIRTEQDYAAALAEIDLLIDSEPGTAKYDRLEVLSLIVEAYEEQAHKIPVEDIDPIDAIKFWAEQNNMSRKDLEPYLGSSSKVSDVLNGKRPLSTTMIRKLVGAGIPAELLIRPINIEKAA